jgi:hypothetical protein
MLHIGVLGLLNITPCSSVRAVFQHLQATLQLPCYGTILNI